jgi:hypothetical protein
VHCQVEVFASGRSPGQGIPTDGGYVIHKPQQLGGRCPSGVVLSRQRIRIRKRACLPNFIRLINTEGRDGHNTKSVWMTKKIHTPFGGGNHMDDLDVH